MRIPILALTAALFVICQCAGCRTTTDATKKPLTLGHAPQQLAQRPAELDQIEQLIKENHPDQALKDAKKWIKDHQDSDFLDEATFLKAQALFDKKLYHQAFRTYEKLLDNYATSRRFETALEQEVEIARRFLAGAKRKIWGWLPSGARTEALEIIDRVAQRWPGSQLAATALMMKADYYYRKGRFDEAQLTYQIIVDNYATSDAFEPALLGSAQSLHSQYHGPRYDGAPLHEAWFRYQQYQARYPQQAQNLGVAERLSQIETQLAHKDFVIADFYRRTHQPDAARHYWNYIPQRWPDTVSAHKARQMLQTHPAPTNQ